MSTNGRGSASFSILRSLQSSHPWRFNAITAIGALLAAGVTTVSHRHWSEAPSGTPQRGLLDILCHMGTALAVALPVLPYVKDRSVFLRVAMLSAVAIDLDHILAARSVRLVKCMTMSQRPASHSLLAPLLIALIVERRWPARHVGLGVLLGLSSHLLRDLGTGGAPLFHPRRVIAIPYGIVVIMLGALALSSRHATRIAIGARFVPLTMRVTRPD